LPLKDVIQEKFGRWLMSAIDFTSNVEKIEDPRAALSVQSSCGGKFLPNKKWVIAAGESPTRFFSPIKNPQELGFRPTHEE